MYALGVARLLGSGLFAPRPCATLVAASPPPTPSPALPRPCRDLLRAYAARQQFKVKPVAKSQCYTGDRLLEQFGFPHEGDAAVVAKAYPWLRGYDAGCKAAQAVWGSY